MRTFNKILIPTDFSAAAWLSVQMALDLSKSKHVSISLVHVYPVKNRANSSNEEAIQRRSLNKLEQEMKTFAANLEKGIDACIKPILLNGNVNEEILSFIAHEPHDLVIVGVNSHVSDNETGRHTAEIIKRSGVPVLVVPNKQVRA